LSKNVQKNVQNLRGLVEPMKKNIGKAFYYVKLEITALWCETENCDFFAKSHLYISVLDKNFCPFSKCLSIYFFLGVFLVRIF